MRDRGLAQEERGVHVHRHHLPVVVLGDVGEVIRARDAGHVAQHIEPAEAVDAIGDGGVALFAARQISGASDDRCTGRRNLLGQGFEPGRIAIVGEDRGTLARQAHGDRSTDPGRGARDERNASVEARRDPCHVAAQLGGAGGAPAPVG